MDKRPIGVFDSGIGGLTCVKEIMNVMPNENVIYFGDTGRVPYGTRSAQTIMKYVRQDINFLSEFDIKMIIIACGTASSVALPQISNETKCDITGVLEPAAIKAAKTTKNGKIGIIGTPTTIKLGKYAEHIKGQNARLEVFQKACPMFVPLVENGYLNSEATKIIAREYLEELKEAEIDTLILGCTHYPLLRQVIREIMGENVKLIDSGAAAADFAYEALKERGMLGDEKENGKIRYFVSDTVDDFSRIGSMFLEKPICAGVEKIDIEKY